MKRTDSLWRDHTGDLNTWDQLIDEYQVRGRECAALHELLIRHKIPKRDVDNACYQARAQYYAWKKAEKFRPELIKKTEAKPLARPPVLTKKTTRRVKK